MRDGAPADDVSPTMEAAIDRSLRALAAACASAARVDPGAAGRVDDPTWLRTEMDRWVQMPTKIRAVSQLGQLHLAVYWDQVFGLCAFSRSAFATLADVMAYYRRSALGTPFHPSTSTRWRALMPDGVPRRAHLVAQRERWRRFVCSHRCIAHDGAVYVDLADLLRDALCHWTGHWTFDGVVLDRYDGDEIDYGHYFRVQFRAADAAARFERFREQMTAAKITRETTWSLLSPSGERVWKLVAVFSIDGNTDAFLLECDGEFLDVYASGS